MPRYDYNLIAIGAGSGGLVTTLIGAAIKAKVALIEKHRMGGDCLNTGCVPSKSLIASAKVVQLLKKHEAFGLKNVQYEVDFPQVMERIQEIIAKIAPHDSVERFTKLGVECHLGEARIGSPHEIEVNGRVLTTKNIVVSTGARPFVPPIPGLEEVAFSHSDNLWELACVDGIFGEEPETLGVALQNNMQIMPLIFFRIRLHRNSKLFHICH